VKNNTKHEVMHHTTYKVQSPPKQRIDQNQYNSMAQYAQNKLLDTMCLDQLLFKYLKQTGSIVDVDDLSRLLDGKELFIWLRKKKIICYLILGNLLHNLIHQFQNIDEHHSRTLDNYGAKKLHLNSYMNVVSR
jgi:hypothetical protein